MDPQVRALVQHAAEQLTELTADLDDHGDWAGETAVLLRMQAVATDLVEAARRHAQDLSGRAPGRHGPPMAG